MKKLNELLLKNYTFPLLTGLLCAAIFAGSHMFVVHGFGFFNEIAQAEMIRQGMETGDYAAAVSFAAGFLIARVLEGPLVGILDIGGSLMTGVGTGMVGFCLSMGWDAPVKSFVLALIAGFGIGLVIGGVIIAVKKSMPESMAASGTNIMMGAGNAVGRYLGPLIILSAAQYSIPAGIGALIGSAIFFKMKKEIVGGAILGALILAVIFPVPV